jgi:hypothetical protein
MKKPSKKFMNKIMNENAMVRERLVRGITEEEFIQDFEEIMGFSGFRFFEPNDKITGRLARLTRLSMPSCLNKIHSMNPTGNSWADYEKISDKLKAFLKLRGEEI